MEQLKTWFMGLPIIGKIGIVFAGLLCVIIILGQDAMQQRTAEREAKERRAAMTPEQLRDEKIREAFSGWDGSHRRLTEYVKGKMNDPSSFEHVETRYADKGSYVYVEMSFRGKNAFGAVVLQTVTAKAKIDGELIEVGMK